MALGVSDLSSLPWTEDRAGAMFTMQCLDRLYFLQSKNMLQITVQLSCLLSTARFMADESTAEYKPAVVNSASAVLLWP